jgi:hypothetical protein
MDRAEHLLVILMEECAEVQKIASKALRFGLDNRDPEVPDSATNAEEITKQCADLIAVLSMLTDEGLLTQVTDLIDIETKKEKVEYWLSQRNPALSRGD